MRKSDLFEHKASGKMFKRGEALVRFRHDTHERVKETPYLPVDWNCFQYSILNWLILIEIFPRLGLE